MSEETNFWNHFVESVRLVSENPNHPALAHVQQIKDGVNLKDENGDTPLMLSSRTGHVEASKLLLGMGAHIDAQNVNGITALMLAVHGNHVETVKLLMANNANVHLKTADGLSALRTAKIGTGLTKLFARSKIIAMLHQAGAKE
jgi:ankyrin repeat protein